MGIGPGSHAKRHAFPIRKRKRKRKRFELSTAWRFTQRNVAHGSAALRDPIAHAQLRFVALPSKQLISNSGPTERDKPNTERAKANAAALSIEQSTSRSSGGTTMTSPSQ